MSPVKTKKIIDTSLGVPAGMLDMLECGGCGSLFRGKAVDTSEDCPVCGMPPDESQVLARVRSICEDCVDGAWGCSGPRLAKIILDEMGK